MVAWIEPARPAQPQDSSSAISDAVSALTPPPPCSSGIA